MGTLHQAVTTVSYTVMKLVLICLIVLTSTKANPEADPYYLTSYGSLTSQGLPLVYPYSYTGPSYGYRGQQQRTPLQRYSALPPAPPTTPPSAASALLAKAVPAVPGVEMKSVPIT